MIHSHNTDRLFCEHPLILNTDMVFSLKLTTVLVCNFVYLMPIQINKVRKFMSELYLCVEVRG